MAKIVIPDDYPPVIRDTPALKRLHGCGEVVLHNTKPEGEGELIGRIGDAEIAVNIRAYCRFTRGVMEGCRKLRMISVWGTGVDNIDLLAAKDRGITVTNTPDAATESVAEHTLALMLAAAREIPRIDGAVRRGEWPRGLVAQLYGKTLGVIGTGAIGERVVRLGKGIGMDAIAWTFHPSPEKGKALGISYVGWETLFRTSDVVSLHLRLSAETRGLVGMKEFRMMKPTSIFINTARGAIVDEEALCRALTEGLIAGAGLDVYSQEPIEPGNPILKLPNVVLTPHSAGQTPEVLARGLRMAAENVANFLAGRPSNVVTP